ncbi:MAG: hypothetical protein WB562_15545, partial [Candidatus Sulfotelmatobacter sp.]
GSQVIYATTDGLGPIDGSLESPAGGNVWVTTDAAAASGNTSTFVSVTNNGPGGNINPSEFPISAVAIDTSDSTGNTAYVTVMGFTGGPGHVWQTTNAGATWADFTGSFTSALPDSPVNAVVVDPVAQVVYVGTDVGVFQSSTASPVWGEVGPSSGQAGFLPNVAVTALALFNSGGQKILRASTYGRGVWQAYLVPGFEIAVSDATQTVLVGQPVIFHGALISEGGYNNSVALTCVAGTTSPPNGCTPVPVSLTPTADGAPFTVFIGSAGSVFGDFFFGVQGTGFGGTPVNVANLTLHVVNFDLTTPSPISVTTPPGTISPPVGFQVQAQGLFSQSVTLACVFNPDLADARCNFTPGQTVNPPYPAPMTASVSVPASAAAGNYTVTLQATSAGATAPAAASFTLSVSTNPVGGYTVTGPQTLSVAPGGQVTSSPPLKLTSVNGYSGDINATCDASALPGTQCSVSPNAVTLASGGTANLTATINVPTNASPGTYNVDINTADISGAPSNTFPIQLTVAQDYILGNFSPGSATISAGGSASYNFSVLPVGSAYNGSITLQCSIAPVFSGSCTFSPNPATTASGNVLMTVQSQAGGMAATAGKESAWAFALGLAVPGIVMLGSRSRRRRGLPLGFVLALLLFLLSCGSGSNGGASQQRLTSGTYTITVTGTPVSLSQPQGSGVTLIVQ